LLGKAGNVFKDTLLRPSINLLDNEVTQILIELGFTINNLARFLNRNTDLNFNDITARFLMQYHEWMQREGLGIRGQTLYLGAIRALFNAAVDKYNDYDNDVITIRVQPFRRFKVPKNPFVNNAELKALPVETLRTIFAYQPKSKRDGLAKDIFMLSFCLCGMNAKDLYTCDRIDGNMIIYNRSKTKDRSGNGAEMRVSIPIEVMPIAEKYFANDSTKVFDFRKRYMSAQYFNEALAGGMAIISEALAQKITFYSARHSWATIAINDLHLSEELVDECLVHAPVRKMLHKYVKRDWARIDATNRKVLDYVFENKNN
jgi:integrase